MKKKRDKTFCVMCEKGTRNNCDECSSFLCIDCRIKIKKHCFGICFYCLSPHCEICDEKLIYKEYKKCHTCERKKLCKDCINYGYCKECFERDLPKTKCDLCETDLEEILNKQDVSNITCECNNILCEKCVVISGHGNTYCIKCMYGDCCNCLSEITKDSGWTCRECREELCELCSYGSEYCDECKQEQESEEYDINEIESERQIRYEKLKHLLEKQGLKLRNDSKLCYKYINTGQGDLDYIIERMSQMKYLYEYCDMKKELEKVSLENEEILEAGYFPDMSVFDEAEANILERIDEYPKVWPWHLDKYARIIQKGCHNWLWKPITADGKHGINLRIGLNALEKEKNL